MGSNSDTGVVSTEDETTRVDPSQDPEPVSEKEGVNRSDVPPPNPREVRHAHLFVTNIDPWSVMKNSFMFALAIGIVMIIAVMVLWMMLSLSGTFDSIARTVSDIVGSGPQALDVRDMFSFSKVVGTTAVLAVLEVVLVTALITLFAFLYNIAVGLTGGLQITLTNDS